MKEENAAFDDMTVSDSGTLAAAAEEKDVLVPKKKKTINRAKLQDNLWGWAFVILLVLGTTVFVYIAFIITLILSFTAYRGGNLFEYLGEMKTFNNDALYWFKHMFSNAPPDYFNPYAAGDAANFWATLGNSFFYLIGIPVGMILSILIAVCMSRDIKCTNAFRVIYYIPTVASVVSISLVWKRLFNYDGAINHLLGSSVHWLDGTAVIRKITILILTTWKGLGGSVILFVAGLNGVNASYHEAAEIDGANGWSIFWRITLPQLYPTIFYVLVTSVIGGMQIYVEPELIYGGFEVAGSGTPVTPFVGYIMSVVNFNGDYAYGCALSVMLALIIFVLTLIEFAIDSRRDKV